MAQQWPLTLQQILNQEGFGITFGETAVKTEMDTGPVKIRRRFTEGVDTASGTIWVTAAQYSTLKTFFDTTLNGGVERFEFDHPITGTLTEWRFRAPPVVNFVGHDTYAVTMEWEAMP